MAIINGRTNKMSSCVKRFYKNSSNCSIGPMWISGLPTSQALRGIHVPENAGTKRAEKTRVTRDGGHLRINVSGMVCPRSAEFFAIEASHSDSATYQAFLDQADKSISFQRTTIRAFGPTILDVINNPKKIQKTACIGTLL